MQAVREDHLLTAVVTQYRLQHGMFTFDFCAMIFSKNSCYLMFSAFAQTYFVPESSSPTRTKRLTLSTLLIFAFYIKCFYR